MVADRSPEGGGIAALLAAGEEPEAAVQADGAPGGAQGQHTQSAPPAGPSGAADAAADVAAESAHATTDVAAGPAHATTDVAADLTRAFSAPARRWWPQRRRGPFLGDERRLPGLDAVRGLALAGMMAAHAAKEVEGMTSPDWLGFANGHSSILFATVAGVSLAIITGGQEAHTGARVLRDRLRIFARAFALFVLGSLMALLGTPIGIILGSYGLWFVLALPFLRCRVRTLLLVAGVFLGFGWLLQWVSLFVIGSLELNVEGQVGNTLLALFLTSQYPAVIWLGFVLVGLALGRAGLRRAATLWRWGLSGALVFVACVAPFVWQAGSLDPVWGKPSPSLTAGPPAAEQIECWDGENLYPCTPQEQQAQMSSWSDAQWEEYFRAQETREGTQAWERFKEAARSQWNLAPHSGSPFEALGSAGFAVAAICALTALGRWAKRLLAPLVALGSMSLSSYCLHVVLMWYFAHRFTGESNGPFLLMLGAIAALALVWAALFQRGPLEQAMAWFADGAARLPAAVGAPATAARSAASSAAPDPAGRA